MKRFLSILLTLFMLVAILPLNVFAKAEGDDVTASMYTDSYDLSSVDGVGDVLVKAATADEEQDDVSYSFSYLSVTGKTASVGLNNSEACTIVVAVYSEEDGQMLGSGHKEIEANAFETTVEIEIDKMPEYFILKAFMLDGNMMALCKPFFVIEYSRQFEIFDQKTVDDFGDSVIINFDDQEDDNFAVLADGAKEVSSSANKNTLVSHDKETGEYVFSNCDDSLTSLSAGDVFEFETNGELYLLKVKSITVSGTSVTIIEDLDATHSDYFQYVDVNESPNPEGTDILVDMSNADDNIVYDGLAQWDGETSSLNPKMKADAKNGLMDVDENYSIGPEFTIKEKYLVGNDKSDVSVKVSGKIKATLNFNIRIYYDADWEWKWDIWNSYSDYFYFQVKIDFKITGSVTLTGAIKHDITFAKIHYLTPAGVIVAVDVKFHVEVSASVTVYIDFLKITVGFKYDEDNGFQNLCSGPTINLSPKLEGQAEVKVGVQIDPIISYLGVIEISLEPEGGAKITLKTDTVDASELLKIKKPDYIHTCSYLNCFNGDIRLYLSCKLKGKIFNKEVKNIKIVGERTWKLFDCNLKLNPFKFSLNKCPNIAYRCDITVTDNADKPLNNVSVKSATGVCDANGDNKYEETETVTDKDGKAVFYFCNGEHKVALSANGYSNQTATIHVLQEPYTLNIKMSGNGGSPAGYTTNTLVTFGSYPQSLVTDSALVKSLNSQPLNWIYYDYYCDGKQEDYMKYADVTLSDGSRYRAVTFIHYRPYRWDNTDSASYTFQDNNGYEPDKVYWFKYEPIVWRVLDAKAGLLMTENLIDSQPLHNVYYRNNRCYYGDESYTHYASNWKYSSLRSWMNNDFCTTAFGAEKNYIKKTKLTTSSVGSAIVDSDPTEDNVFLLSTSDVINTSYGFSSDDNGSGKETNRLATCGTDYARCQGLHAYTTTTVYYYIGAADWRLRTPYNDSSTAFVNCDGRVKNGYGMGTYETDVGIRPALCVNLKSAISQSIIKKVNVKVSSPLKKSNLTTGINTPAEPAAEKSKNDGLKYNLGAAKPKTASHSDCVIGNEYVFVCVKDPDADLLAEGNLLYIDQKTAESGTVEFTYTAAAGTELFFGMFAGDIDGNGQILADDARLALRASAKLETLDAEQTKAADVNEDGLVLADDARQILRYSAKLQQEFDKKK